MSASQLAESSRAAQNKQRSYAGMLMNMRPGLRVQNLQFHRLVVFILFVTEHIQKMFSGYSRFHYWRVPQQSDGHRR